MTHSIHTEETTCKGEVSVFARPNRNYDPETPESPSFTYELKEGRHHWDRKAVLVVTHEVELGVPAGVNLVAAAVATLRESIEEKKRELAKEISELEDEISKLALITYEPEEEEMVAVLVPGYDGEADVDFIPASEVDDGA